MREIISKTNNESIDNEIRVQHDNETDVYFQIVADRFENNMEELMFASVEDREKLANKFTEIYNERFAVTKNYDNSLSEEQKRINDTKSQVRKLTDSEINLFMQAFKAKNPEIEENKSNDNSPSI